MTFRRSIYRNLPLLLVTSLLMVDGLGAARLTAQTAEALSGVKRVAMDWTETEKSSTEVRDRVLLLLEPHAVEDGIERFVVFFVLGLRRHAHERSQPFGT